MGYVGWGGGDMRGGGTRRGLSEGRYVGGLPAELVKSSYFLAVPWMTVFVRVVQKVVKSRVIIYNG